MPVQEFTPEELETEEWRDVVGYEGIYQVSCLGRVKRVGAFLKRPAGHCLKPGITDGYLNVVLGKDTKATIKSRRVHSIVAEAFIGPRPEGYEINHIDSNRANPRPLNLEYVTRKQNAEHAARARRKRGQPNPHPNHQGENCPSAKLTSQDVITIRRAILDGVKGNVLAKQYGVSAMSITQIKLGVSWKYLPELRDEVMAMGAWKTRRSIPRRRSGRFCSD